MLTFNDIGVTVRGKRLLGDISFSLVPHRITAVIGRNGSGKSTLVSCAAGLTDYTGEILYGEKNIALIPSRERAQLISVLPQLLPKTALTVRELAEMGRNPYLDIGKRLTAADKKQVDAALETAGMTDIAHRSVSSLSGGERQRAYLAMVLAQNTRIIILDEPAAYMDMENEAELADMLRSLRSERRKTVMVVMHDLTRAVELADNILVLKDGENAFFGSAEDCVKSGVIENIFGVKRTECEKDGVIRTLYYR